MKNYHECYSSNYSILHYFKIQIQILKFKYRNISHLSRTKMVTWLLIIVTLAWDKMKCDFPGAFWPAFASSFQEHRRKSNHQCLSTILSVQYPARNDGRTREKRGDCAATFTISVAKTIVSNSNTTFQCLLTKRPLISLGAAGTRKVKIDVQTFKKAWAPSSRIIVLTQSRSPLYCFDDPWKNKKESYGFEAVGRNSNAFHQIRRERWLTWTINRVFITSRGFVTVPVIAPEYGNVRLADSKPSCLCIDSTCCTRSYRFWWIYENNSESTCNS